MGCETHQLHHQLLQRAFDWFLKFKMNKIAYNSVNIYFVLLGWFFLRVQRFSHFTKENTSTRLFHIINRIIIVDGHFRLLHILAGDSWSKIVKDYPNQKL